MEVNVANINKYKVELSRANVVIGNSFDEPSIGKSEWGYITGDIYEQKDLINLLPKYYTESEVPLELTLVLNAGKSETTKEDIRINLRTRGLPTHYMVSEDYNFSNTEWVPFECNFIDFKISPSKGEHTIYGKIKNQYKESERVVAKITLI